MAWSKAGALKPANRQPCRLGGRPSDTAENVMMDQMMGGGMMWGMGLIGLLLIIVLVLGAAALIAFCTGDWSKCI
jgi:hypothetical protein